MFNICSKKNNFIIINVMFISFFKINKFFNKKKNIILKLNVKVPHISTVLKQLT